MEIQTENLLVKENAQACNISKKLIYVIQGITKLLHFFLNPHFCLLLLLILAWTFSVTSKRNPIHELKVKKEKNLTDLYTWGGKEWPQQAKIHPREGHQDPFSRVSLCFHLSVDLILSYCSQTPSNHMRESCQWSKLHILQARGPQRQETIFYPLPNRNIPRSLIGWLMSLSHFLNKSISQGNGCSN